MIHFYTFDFDPVTLALKRYQDIAKVMIDITENINYRHRRMVIHEDHLTNMFNT